MNIGDLIFAPIHRSKPYDLYLARVTGCQQQQQQRSGSDNNDIRLGTVSFEFLRESFGESSDIADHLYKPEEYSWRYYYETKNNDDDNNNNDTQIKNENTTHNSTHHKHRIMMPNDKTFAELEKVRKRLRSEYFLKNQLAGSSFAIHQRNTDSEDAAAVSSFSSPTTTGLLSTSSPRVVVDGTSTTNFGHNNNNDNMTMSPESLKQLHTLFPLAILLELFFVVCFSPDDDDNDDENDNDDEVQISDERIKSSNSSRRSNNQSSSIHVRIVDLWLSSFVMNFPNFLLLKSEFDVQLMMSKNLDHHNDDRRSTSTSSSSTSNVPSEDQMLKNLQQLSPFHQALLSTSANREKMEAEIDKKKLLSSSSSSSSSLSDYALVYSTPEAADLWFEYYYRVFVLSPSSSSSSSTPQKVKIDIISLKKLFETGGESFSDDDDDDEDENSVYYRLFIGTVDEVALLLEKQRGISTMKNSSSSSTSTSSSSALPLRHRHDQSLIRNLTILPGDDSIEIVAGLAELEVDILEDEMKLEEEEKENEINHKYNEMMNFGDAAAPTTTYNTQARKVNFTHVDSQQIFTTSKIGNLLLANKDKKTSSSAVGAARTRSSHQFNNSKKAVTDQTVKNTNEDKRNSNGSMYINSSNPFLFPEGALLGWMMNATASLNKFRQQTLSNFYLGSRKLCRWGCCCSCVASAAASSSSKSKNNDTTTFASPRLAPCCSLIPCYPVSLFDTSTTARSSATQQQQPPPLFDVNDDYKLLKTFFKLNSKSSKMNSSSTKNNRILLVLQVDIDGGNDDDEPDTSSTKTRQMVQDYFKARVDELVLRNKDESSSTTIKLEIIPLVVFSHEVESFVSSSSSSSASSCSPGLCHTLFHDILRVWLTSSSSSRATTTFDGIILNTTFYRVRIRSRQQKQKEDGDECDVDDNTDMFVTSVQQEQKQHHDDKIAFASSQRQLALFIHSTLLSLNATTVASVVTSNTMKVFRSSCVTRRKYHTLFEDSSPSSALLSPFTSQKQQRYVTEMMLLRDHQSQQSSNDDEMKLFRPLPELRKLQPVAFVRSFDFMDEQEGEHQDPFSSSSLMTTCPALPASAITAVERLLFCPVVSNNNNNNNEELNMMTSSTRKEEEENLSNIPFVSHLANLSKKVVPEPFYQARKLNEEDISSSNHNNQKKKKNDRSASSTSGLRWVSSLWL